MQVHLWTLPPEVILLIVSYLGADDISWFAQVGTFLPARRELSHRD